MRKGFLASLALALAQSAAQAQYFPAPQSYSQPQANQSPVWIVPQQSGNYPAQTMPRGAMPAGNASYLPQGYFPATTLRPVPPPAPATPVPPEPIRGQATASKTSTDTASNSLTDGVSKTSTEAVPKTSTEAVSKTSTTSVPLPVFLIPPAPAKFVSRPAPAYGPAAYFDTIPASPPAPEEPVAFHRDCHERCWFGLAYQTAWMRQGPLGVPLVTMGSAADTTPGAIGQPGTVVLFGDQKIDYRMLHGLRLDVGRFFDDDNHFSADFSGFYFFPRHVTFNRGSDATGLPILSRPVFNVAQNQESIYTISSLSTDPETGEDIIVAGKTLVDARAQIWGFEINGRWHNYCGHRTHTECLFGFRTVRLEESLFIQDTISPLTGTAEIDFNGLPIAPGDVIIDRDGFRAENQFYGFQFGGKVRWEGDYAFVDLIGKVAMGITDQRARIEGSTTLVSPGLTQTAVGGILALPSNIGEHNRQVFGIIPEIGINFGANITPHLRATAGYSCLMWSGVTRPGLLIDRNVNPVQVPTDQEFAAAVGGTRPLFQWREQVLWLQTLSFGLEFHY
jgi:hypothetical protein